MNRRIVIGRAMLVRRRDHPGACEPLDEIGRRARRLLPRARTRAAAMAEHAWGERSALSLPRRHQRVCALNAGQGFSLRGSMLTCSRRSSRVGKSVDRGALMSIRPFPPSPSRLLKPLKLFLSFLSTPLSLAEHPRCLVELQTQIPQITIIGCGAPSSSPAL